MKTFADFGIELNGASGAEVRTTCPRCSHTRKKAKARCLSVNTADRVWYCHHCDWRGSLKAGEESASNPPKRFLKPAFTKPNEVPPVVRDWFAKRGVPENIVARHCIALETVYIPQVEGELPCLAFPYLRDGEVVNVKYRSLEGKHFRQVKDAEKILYGLDDLTEDWTIIVEGECDKLALEVAGITNVVSVPDGAPPAGSKPKGPKFDYLVTSAEQLDRLTKIVLAIDNDAAGTTLEEELARRLGPERCWRVTWPAGCKDANDVLMTHGPDVLARYTTNAKPYPIEGIFEVADVANDVMALYEQGLPRGVSTGSPSVDGRYTVRPGELTLVTGIPSHGKSEWLDWLMIQLAVLHGWVFAVCSPENFPLARHIAKLAEEHVGRPFRVGPSERMTPLDLSLSLQWVHDHFVFIAPEDSITIDSLLTKAKSLVARRGIRGLVIDPWNEFDHRRPINMAETEHISECLGKIRRFARNHGVHVWLVAHPQKLYRIKGKYPVPTPYDISGSAHFRNKADNCLTVWRDENEPDKPVKLFVQKIRFREVGKIGVIDLRWNHLNGRYEERG